MKRFITILYLVVSVIFIVYLILPEPTFPTDLPNSYKSIEPGDLEDPLRPAFYTDMTRAEVIAYYQPQFKGAVTLRLNYPPEEAQILIHDQTHSIFLEELVHPFRESLYINGYEPQTKESPFIFEGKHWKQKITIKYVKSDPVVRVTVAALSMVLGYILILEAWRLLLGSRRLFR